MLEEKYQKDEIAFSWEFTGKGKGECLKGTLLLLRKIMREAMKAEHGIHEQIK